MRPKFPGLRYPALMSYCQPRKAEPHQLWGQSIWRSTLGQI